ncbi:hypothetical protein GCK32_008806, partial [Trichostrongylus colubriformis]
MYNTSSNIPPPSICYPHERSIFHSHRGQQAQETSCFTLPQSDKINNVERFRTLRTTTQRRVVYRCSGCRKASKTTW